MKWYFWVIIAAAVLLIGGLFYYYNSQIAKLKEEDDKNGTNYAQTASVFDILGGVATTLASLGVGSKKCCDGSTPENGKCKNGTQPKVIC